MEKIFWDVQNNVLLFVAKCKDCGGFAWYAMGESTGGIWQDFGCRHEYPKEDEYVEVKIKQENT